MNDEPSIEEQANVFPHNEYDPSAHPDSNAQHMRYMLEGYRAQIVDPWDLSPYAPGTTRDVSWTKGFNQAREDKVLAVTPSPQVCPNCHAPFENIQHPAKPAGVFVMRTCKCEVTTQPIEGGGTITIITPPDAGSPAPER